LEKESKPESNPYTVIAVISMGSDGLGKKLSPSGFQVLTQNVILELHNGYVYLLLHYCKTTSIHKRR